MYLVHKTPLKKTKIQPLPFTDIVSRACIILKNSKKNTSQPPPVYSLSTRDLRVVDTPRSESRLSYDLDSKRGIEGKKKRLHALLSPWTERPPWTNVMDFCDPLPSHSFMRLYILLLIPSSLLSNWEIPDGSVSSSYSAVLCTPAGPNLRLFTLSSSSSSYLLHSGHK